MLIQTEQFWSYLINEPDSITNRAKELLTFKQFDFDTKSYRNYYYWQEIFKWEDYKVIRFPTGLVKRLQKILPVDTEKKIDLERKRYTSQDVLKTAELIKEINPKFDIREYQMKACLIALNGFNSLIQSAVGSGKEQPVDTIIPTPDGFKRFGDLKVGDKVFGKDGKEQSIVGVFPQGVKDIYEVSFQNGAKVECGLEHLWTIRKNRGKEKTITLNEIYKDYYKIDSRGYRSYNYSVDYCDPVQYSTKNYFISPYLLGILIGDGTLTTRRIGFSCPDIEKEIIDNITLNPGYHLHCDYKSHYNYNTKKCPQYYISLDNLHSRNEYKKEIIRLKLNKKSNLKFIPTEYFLGSEQQRKELLAGLLDSDGSCKKRAKHCSITYGTTSEQLAKDVQQLVFSLGGAARIRSFTRENRNTEYVVSIEVLFNPFKLSRKASNFVPYRVRNTITDIKLVRKEEAVCIKVTNDDELYLTTDYIPTHNTSVISMVCKVLENDKILITNGNNNILQQIYERLLSFGISDIGWNPSAEPDYNKRIVLINCATSHSRLNSKDEKYIEFLKTVDTWIIDECHHFQSFTGFEPIFYTKADKLKRLIGFTATPFRKYDAPYENEQDFTTIALFGEPAFEYEMKDTIEDKNIAQPYSYFINYKNYVPKLPTGFEKDYFMQYRMGITYNKARNAAGLAMLKYLSEHGINTLACVNKIKNGQKLMETLAKQGIKCKFICGNQSGGLGNSIFEYIPNKRGTLKLIETTGVPEDIEKSFDEGYHIIFSTNVMQEGVDIQRFQAAVLFTGAKNFIGTTQMIGRATRQKKNGKNIAFVIDFKDIGGIPILADHYEIRKAAMKSNGIINIEKVQDFCKLIESIDDEQEESDENKK